MSYLRFLRHSLLAGFLAAFILGQPGETSAEDRVVITEFMAINNSTLTNQYGAHPDWIELYNTGPASVNLDGWYLTDDPANLSKWRFPATNRGPAPL